MTLAIKSFRLATGEHPGRFHVEIDGNDISGAATSVDLRLRPGHIPALTVDFAMLEVLPFAADEAEIHIPDATRKALIGLGWTPPKEPADADA